MENLYILLPIFGLVLLSVFGWLFFWKKLDRKFSEPFGLMVLAMFWGAVFTYVLLMFLGQCNFNTRITSSFLVILALEEFTKSFALVNALECADKKFNEINDGIIYGASSALGFVLIENILYLQNENSAFWEVFWGRSFYSAMGHMVFSAIFGLYYAQAYLGPLVGRERKKKRAPISFIAMIFKASIESVPTAQRNIFRDLYEIIKEFIKLFTLHITRRHVIWGKPTHGHWAGEILMEGFLLAYYLHIAFDELLMSQNIIWQNIALGGIVIIFGLIIKKFKDLEDKNNLKKIS